jgi:hypothetical protein
MLSRGMRESSTRDFGFAFDFSARIDQCDSVHCAVPSPALPCFFFSGVAPLGVFRGGAEAILAAQRPDFMVKRRIFLKRIKG